MKKKTNMEASRFLEKARESIIAIIIRFVIKIANANAAEEGTTIPAGKKIVLDETDLKQDMPYIGVVQHDTYEEEHLIEDCVVKEIGVSEEGELFINIFVERHFVEPIELDDISTDDLANIANTLQRECESL